jgi:hypothetical protein
LEASEGNPTSPANADILNTTHAEDSWLTGPVPLAADSRSLDITALAVFSLLLAVVTGIPQLYYVLYAINPHVFTIGPNSNPLGSIWFNYILGGQQGGYLHVDAGTLGAAIEDAFMMAPLYLATGIGLLRRSKWVYPVGLITGAMIFYANLYFFLSGVLVGPYTTTDIVTTVVSSIPYFVYPLWLVPTLLLRRSLFDQ